MNVVFIHGMWSQASVWERWLGAFAARGFACADVTLPAHHAHASDDELRRVGFAECVDAALQVCERVARPVLIGHSMGGLIAQKLATLVQPRALVLINSAAPRAVFPLRGSNVRGLARHFFRWGLWDDVLRLSNQEADYLLYNGLPEAERSRHHVQRCGESGRLAYQLGFGRLGSPLHDIDADAIRCPMLAFAGLRDRMIPIEVSRAMARHYGLRLDYREHDNAHWMLAEPGYRARIDDVLGWLSAHVELPNAGVTA